jgi:PKD repeat protein
VKYPRRGLSAAVIAVVCAAGMVWTVPAAAAGSPKAELSIEPASSPLSVTLEAGSTGFPAKVVSYFFQFGDGQTATTGSAEVTHTYASAGRYAPEVTETDAAGDMASATGTLELDECPAGSSCTQTLRNVSGITKLSATGPIQVGGPSAAVDLFAGPYKIENCQSSVLTDGALTDSGFTGNLVVTMVYRAPPGQVNTTCFASAVPFTDADGKTVYSGPLPMCPLAGAVPPCVVSITTKILDAEVLAIKVVLIPPGDPKVGAL